MADPFDEGSSDPFGGTAPEPLPPQGPIPKPGQAVPPTNVPEQFTRGREAATQLGADITGVMDVRRVMSGETPVTEALGGAIPMALGGPEARVAKKVAGPLMRGMEELYPKVGPPILKDAVTNKPIKDAVGAVILRQGSVPEAQAMVDAGKAYWGKHLTPEAKAVQKQRQASQKDIDLGNYTPYFKVSERGDVNPTRYETYHSTTNIMPARPETIEKYMKHASNPEGIARLQAAYEKGLTLPNAGNWYFLSQLEKEFIREFGDRGTAMFKARVADALAATTGGADPNANLMMAQYGNYLQARGLMPPEEAHQFPFPVGGRFAGENLKEYRKMLMEGVGVTAENPKRYNFSAALRGNPQAGTIDEQMSKLYDPKMSMPEYYGPYQQVLNDLAEKNGVDPRYFQEVAWSGTKALRDPGYIPKPMIQEYNEAIERTARITGVPPAEVVRRGILRAEMPLYGAAGGVIGAGQVRDEQQQMPGGHQVLQIDPAAAGLHVGGPMVRLPKPPPAAKAASHVIDLGIEQQRLSEEAQTAFGAGAE